MRPIDVPGDATTPVVIGIGEIYDGSLEVKGDRDFVRIDLVAGQTVAVTLDGFGDRPLRDPILAMADGDGNVLEFSNDRSDSRNAGLVFTAAYTGSFYIGVGGFEDVFRGTYRLEVETAEPLTDPTAAIDWGTQVADQEITVYFGDAGYRRYGLTSDGFNPYEIGQFEKAFAAISAVADLTFTIVDKPRDADFKLILDTDGLGPDLLGLFLPPGEEGAGFGAFNGQIWDRTAGGDLEMGGFSFVTVVHELMHGLGLAHPHDAGGGSDVMPGVISEFGSFGNAGLNEGVYTIMTYNSGYLTGTKGSAPPKDGGYGYEAGPMALDIAVLQEKYGANMTTNLGETTYVLPKANVMGTKWVSIWDAGGIDTIRHDGGGLTVIDLRAATLAYEEGGGGFISAKMGIAGGFTIANGVVIERAIGGMGGDLIIGNDADNILVGRRGRDLLEGHTGKDVISGNIGNDILVGGAGGDTLTGGSGADVFQFRSFRDSRWPPEQRDMITDFTRSEDLIDLSEIGIRGPVESNGGFTFIGQDQFSGEGAGTAGELRFQVGSEGLYIQADIDGNGRADLRVYVEDLNRIGASDFFLV
jgi:serralysin